MRNICEFWLIGSASWQPLNRLTNLIDVGDPEGIGQVDVGVLALADVSRGVQVKKGGVCKDTKGCHLTRKKHLLSVLMSIFLEGNMANVKRNLQPSL